MSSYNTLEIFGYPVFIAKLDQIDLKDKCIVNTINQYSYVMAENDTVFKEALLNSDVLLPDGVGIVAAAQLTRNRRIKKIAGADIHKHLLQQLNEQEGGGRCFYLGSLDKTLQTIHSRLSEDYPNITVASYSPPFKPIFTEEDNNLMIEKVNAFKPDVLFVGMTAPKQEKWVFINKDKIDARIVCSIGAVFDFYAGTIKRPGRFWIKIGMEWMVRLSHQPRRLWKRYLYYGPVFIADLVKVSFNNIFHRGDL